MSQAKVNEYANHNVQEQTLWLVSSFAVYGHLPTNKIATKKSTRKTITLKQLTQFTYLVLLM